MIGIEQKRGKYLFNDVETCRKHAIKRPGSRFILLRPDGKYTHIATCSGDDMLACMLCRAMGGKFIEWVVGWHP